MENAKRKSLEQLSDESEQFEIQFDRLVAGELEESERATLIAAIGSWLRFCNEQGRYMPPVSADRRALRSLIVRWNSRLRDQGAYVDGIGTLADFDPQAGFALTVACPYPGLVPYTASERQSFFGREALISSCVEHLDQPGNRLLLIIGASGSGKSSLALAGVLPLLAERHAHDWRFAPRFTPGAHPLREMAAVVAATVGEGARGDEIWRQLAANPGDAPKLLASLCRNQPLMLFVDQFEELLTIVRDADEQTAFARALRAGRAGCIDHPLHVPHPAHAAHRPLGALRK